MDKSDSSRKKHLSVGKSSLGAIATVVLVGVYSLLQPMLEARWGLNLPKLGAPATNEVAEERNPDTIPASPTTTAQADLLYGVLREVAENRYISQEGLLYNPGSAEGHRLEHLRRHTRDDPSRPGSHGVFDGEMEGMLRTIDRAYAKAKSGDRTTVRVDDGRTIYTVDLGTRVGYVGGISGGRRQNPLARRVRIVLEDTGVITAYPME
ncbi:hypothetical protein Pla52o_18190 [Novipirellula galeiformis]|uniref:Uncharacterized protein n=1 Tax=Novipirellula galeiformis TaxID=2528004 RepID=A0A5C6CL79_9BACT|nr:hypothetical protein [Novipirellula galeiformis]TWU23896.1 hypothetical protein Pla52o_18190 [Novipirellula galeiformis]